MVKRKGENGGNPPANKKEVRCEDEYAVEFLWITRSIEGSVWCKYYNTDFSIVHSGKSDITKHQLTEKHTQKVVDAKSSGIQARLTVLRNQAATSQDDLVHLQIMGICKVTS